MATKYIKVSAFKATANESGLKPTHAEIVALDERIEKMVDEHIASLHRQLKASREAKVVVTIEPIVAEESVR